MDAQDTVLDSVESEEMLIGDMKALALYERIKTQIERDLTDLSSAIEEINKMRENLSKLEFDLVSRVNSCTWESISELIGVSTTMTDCIKIPSDDQEGVK